MSDDPMIAQYDEQARVIGMVAVTWSGAQESLFMVFCELADLPRAHADAIFFSLKADSAQRDITTALAKEVLSDAPDLLSRLKALIDLMGNSAGERNAAIHTMWRADREQGRITPSPITARHHRSLKADHAAQFRTLADKMADTDGALYQLALEIRLHLASRRKHLPRASQLEDNAP